MSRYNNFSGNSNSNQNSGDFNDTTLKLQKYSAIEVVGDRVSATDTSYGDRFIVGFDDVNVLDGIVFQREDKPDTWKVFSPGKFFHADEESGLVYTSEGGDQMSAQEILENPRVLGFSETFGGTDYFYQPVGVVIEAADDVAVNEDVLGAEAAEQANAEGVIPVGEVSMLLSNKSWTRTLAKLLTKQGDEMIATDDNGDTIKEPHGWLTSMEPLLRTGIEGRTMELFIVEETAEFGGEEVTYTQPVLLDAKTGNRIKIDNDVDDVSGDDSGSSDEQEAEAEPAAPVADGGSTAVQQDAESESESDDADDESEAGDVADETGAGEVPDELDQLLDYFARTDGEATPEELREFAEDEVDDADAIDWQAASEEVARRAE